MWCNLGRGDPFCLVNGDDGGPWEFRKGEKEEGEVDKDAMESSSFRGLRCLMKVMKEAFDGGESPFNPSVISVRKFKFKYVRWGFWGTVTREMW